MKLEFSSKTGSTSSVIIVFILSLLVTIGIYLGVAYIFHLLGFLTSYPIWKIALGLYILKILFKD